MSETVRNGRPKTFSKQETTVMHFTVPMVVADWLRRRALEEKVVTSVIVVRAIKKEQESVKLKKEMQYK